GLWLGFPKIINALWFAFVIGGIYGAYLLLTRQAKLKTAVPFGPFLILGGWIAYTLNYGIF
ncbi:MAG: prepilin peptidase, partial [Patescibacteria group bacterium]